MARTIIGTLSLPVDDVGLKFSFEAPNTTSDNDMFELVHRGNINKCLFRFIVEAEKWLYTDEINGSEYEYDEHTILKATVRHLEHRKTEFLQINQPEQKKKSIVPILIVSKGDGWQ